ncbi:unnamed protein product [Polarella glacialis]|uniref:Pectate lyase superfamily protein domain-containing protein n=2 Tax=Polarella glacialis TaxID=89957 RepID=A0A813DT42_POLGL|nr:unnamed protein product [Polarella glacialis]CAE8682683.1 unnamed protein product [Polarella glacialis]
MGLGTCWLAFGCLVPNLLAGAEVVATTTRTTTTTNGRVYSHSAQRAERLLRRAPAKLRHRAAAFPSAQRSAFRFGALRLSPVDFGADPTGQQDSTAALHAAVQHCINQSVLSPNGVFPGSEDNWGPVRDAGGCTVDLEGGEYLISQPIVVPEFLANMGLGFGSLVANAKSFPPESFLIVVGTSGSCNFPQGSCNMDLNFPELFLDGSHVASGMQINNVMGTTIGPGGYFLNFSSYGVQINKGHEVMMDQCWLGETNFDFVYAKHGSVPNSTAIQINGNDHYILNTVVFSSKIGLEVNGAADYVTGVHVWFPFNQALAFKDSMAFHVNGNQNRFNGCYIDGGRVVFEQSALSYNTWTNGFECCAEVDAPHGVFLRGDAIGPGLEIFSNIFAGGSIIHEPSSPGKLPTVVESRITDNSFSSAWRSSQATQSMSQVLAVSWKFDFCTELVFAQISRVSVSLQSEAGFPRHAVRPPQNCTVQIETDMPVTGTMTVHVDSSQPHPKAQPQHTGPVYTV